MPTNNQTLSKDSTCHPKQDIEILHEMFLPEILTEPEVRDDGTSWLTLTDPEHKKSRITIRNLLPYTLAIKSDLFPDAPRFFRSKKGEAKRSDYFLICASELEKWVVFVEMKSSSKFLSFENIKNQFLGSRCFFEYVKFTGREFWKCPGFLSGYVERYVAFPNACSVKKRSQCLERTSGAVHDRPDRFLRMNESLGVLFRKIV